MFPDKEALITATVASVFDPTAGEIRCAPEEAARFLRAIAFAGTHPRLTDIPMTPHEIVTLLLDGIRERDEEA